MSAGRTDISRTTIGAIADFVGGDFACMPRYLYFYPEGGGASICLDHVRQEFHRSSCEAVVIAGAQAKLEGRNPRAPEERN